MITKLQHIAQKMLSTAGEVTRLRPVCFCGPSGSGKSTLLKRLMAEHPGAFAFSISHTTRKPRPGEANGKDYHFVSREEMLAAIEKNEFIEHAEFSGNLYGTSKKAVENVLSSGKICALDIDIQGVKSIKKTNLNPIYVFIKAPNLEDLERRLRNRGTETEESLQRRLATAKLELDYEQSESNAFDHIIINDDLDRAYNDLKSILKHHIDQLHSNQSN